MDHVSTMYFHQGVVTLEGRGVYLLGQDWIVVYSRGKYIVPANMVHRDLQPRGLSNAAFNMIHDTPVAWHQSLYSL